MDTSRHCGLSSAPSTNIELDKLQFSSFLSALAIRESCNITEKTYRVLIHTCIIEKKHALLSECNQDENRLIGQFVCHTGFYLFPLPNSPETEWFRLSVVVKNHHTVPWSLLPPHLLNYSWSHKAFWDSWIIREICTSVSLGSGHSWSLRCTPLISSVFYCFVFVYSTSVSLSSSKAWYIHTGTNF